MVNPYTNADFLEAIHTRKAVDGLTHNFYRYPARFSPLFARAAIQTFTKPGDVVLDPFMGGGTTLVEARALGRRAVGTDISELSTFVSRVKTTPLSESDLSQIYDWTHRVTTNLNCRTPVARPETWIAEGYQKNISDTKTWPIRKMLEQALAYIDELPRERQQAFTRCILLKAGQWALDCREKIPTAQEFRNRLLINLDAMTDGAREFSEALEKNPLLSSPKSFDCLPLHGAATKSSQLIARKYPGLRANLIVTSPPYPGVYVLYHRWKVQGRKETPAPYWIAASQDGHGQAHYILGSRKQKGLHQYFQGITSSFQALKPCLDPNALVVQMVAFSDPSWQVSKFLESMQDAGFDEVLPASLDIEHTGRIWREVPGRRWFALIQGELSTSKELVLFHRPRT